MFYTKKIAPESKLSCEKRECAGSALALSDTVVPSMTLPANAGPSSKVRSLNNTPQSGLCRGPRMQPICKKIALESKLSRDFLANVHFLLYLCKKFAHCALACAYE